MMSPVPVLIFVRSMLFLYHVCSGYRVLSASAKYVKGKETMRMDQSHISVRRQLVKSKSWNCKKKVKQSVLLQSVS